MLFRSSIFLNLQPPSYYLSNLDMDAEDIIEQHRLAQQYYAPRTDNLMRELSAQVTQPGDLENDWPQEQSLYGIMDEENGGLRRKLYLGILITIVILFIAYLGLQFLLIDHFSDKQTNSHNQHSPNKNKHFFGKPRFGKTASISNNQFNNGKSFKILNKQRTISSNSIKQSKNVTSQIIQQGQPVKQIINLWKMTPKEKKQLFEKYQKLPASKKMKTNSQYMQINSGKDEEFIKYAAAFEASSEIIKWDQIHLKSSQADQLQKQHKQRVAERHHLLSKLLNIYREKYKGHRGFIEDIKKITYARFLQKLSEMKITGTDFKTNPKLLKIYEKEKAYYQKRYQVGNTQRQLGACVVVPTYNNNVDYRYAWNVQSLIQQEYENVKIIIIDDASTDQTADRIARHLKWRKADPHKIILIKNKNRVTALENTYYAVHKYCDYNQIFYTVDGDDQLVGTQVFRLYNALYQQKQHYILYSNYLNYDQTKPAELVTLGLSQSYPQDIKELASYRNYYHAYSHLRTMITDIFLLIRSDSFKDQSGKFYWTIADNAIYFPALELSCGKVEYLPELQYWYRHNTGQNDWQTTRWTQYGKVKIHIKEYQKPYHCIHRFLSEMKQKINSQS